MTRKVFLKGRCGGCLPHTEHLRYPHRNYYHKLSQTRQVLDGKYDFTIQIETKVLMSLKKPDKGTDVSHLCVMKDEKSRTLVEGPVTSVYHRKDQPQPRLTRKR